LILLLFITATSSIHVAGSGTCPAPEAVQTRLDALVAEPDVAGRSAQLEETSQGLAISILDPAGGIVSRRLLPGDRSCDALAEIAAMILASWLSELRSQAVSAEPLPSEPPPPAPRRPWSWEIGLGLTGSFTGSTFAPGGLFQVELGPAQARWALRAVAAYDGARQMSETPLGAVLWQRIAEGLGGGYTLFEPPYALELGGDLLLSEVLLQGQGFPVDDSTASVDPGLDLSARLVLLRGSWHPWIGLWATVWIRQEIPQIQGPTLTTALPQVEGFLGLGVSWQSIERY
jgi:hypothetical protein